MDIGSIFLILAVLVLTALYVGRPFYDRTSTANAHLGMELSSLLAERDRILNAISELDFDNTLGKIPAEDYPLRREQLVQRGAEVLRQLDEYQDEPVSDSTSARLETALNAGAVNQDDDLETLIAARRREHQEKSSGFCPQCGGAVVQSDRFCPKCGNSLS
ncbi:MAG: zinc ribbon domain-containing protein [Anaerolineales bacterium]|nr:zinc ribbon domain-containing protein [Chloroflexota bacterium]MBL6979637.1 zinc ribbon domain-containing protein [Anaerolineales bacterium]